MASRKSEIEELERELIIRRQQGCDTWELERTLNLARNTEGKKQDDHLQSLRRSLAKLEPGESFDYEEPDELSEILLARPEGPRSIGAGVSREERRNKILGGWTGRVAGCLLGRPVEGWNWQRIKDVLKARHAYPLRDYFPAPAEEKEEEGSPDVRDAVYKNEVQGGVKTDVTNYTVLGLRVLENQGRHFESEDVARQWLADLPYDATDMADRVAYRNFVNGVWPPRSARERNPYREWTGAQIRADMWGYVNPGRPEMAAEMAYRDGRISHSRNGIYAEMWMAGMLAGAFVTADLRQIICIGLSEIPDQCRLAETVQQVMQWHEDDESPEWAYKRIGKRYDDYGDVHAIVNAGIIVTALLWGEGDFSKSLGLAVTGGRDTVCNGAAVGSLLGVLNGIDRVPERWKSPLNDTLMTDIADDSRVSLSDVADRTLEIQSV